MLAILGSKKHGLLRPLAGHLRGAFLMFLGILESGLPLVGVNKENNIIQCYYSVLHVGDELFFLM